MITACWTKGGIIDVIDCSGKVKGYEIDYLDCPYINVNLTGKEQECFMKPKLEFLCSYLRCLGM